MRSEDVAPVIIVALLTFGTAAVLIFRGALGRALARRIEGNAGSGSELEARVQDLEARVAAAEEERNELIGRLDFAERMLMQAKDAPREVGR